MLDTIDTEDVELRATASGELDPELAAWFDEAIRLFVEAFNRASSGGIRSALSSLAAVPRVHGLLVECCAGLLSSPDGAAEPEAHNSGMYL